MHNACPPLFDRAVREEADQRAVTRWAGFAGRLCAALLLAGAAPSFAQAPAPGRYEGELCVATGDAVPDCGPVDVRLERSGRIHVRVADVVYRLQLHRSQVDVVLMHGAMQIDGFTADYEWAGKALNFRDPDKRVSYRLRVGRST